MSNPNLAILELVAKALGPLCGRVCGADQQGDRP